MRSLLRPSAAFLVAAVLTATSLPGKLLAQAPAITATKSDGTPAATKKAPGSTVTYTTTISNSGGAAGTSVTFADPDVPNTTLVPGSVHISPLAINDSYQTLANTTLNVAEPGGPAIQISFGTVLRANDVTLNPPGGTDTSTIVSHTAPANGTLASFDNSDGSFAYVPNAGFVGNDTFTYTVQNNADATLTDTATVTIAVLDTNLAVGGNQKVWYVQNNAVAGGLGRSQDPFDTLLEAQTASAAGDTIYVFTGSGATGQSAGIVLKNSQRLLGEGVALAVPLAVNGGSNPTTLRAPGTAPQIGNSAGDGVAALNLNTIEIRGFTISTTGASSNGVVITTSGGNGGSFEVANNTISAATANGIDVNVGGSGTLTCSIHDNTVTGGGNGIDVNNTAGICYITAFDDNLVTGNTGGVGISVSGATFDATPGAPFNTVAGGITTVGAVGNGVGTHGVVLSAVAGDLSFSDLDIVASSGSGLNITGNAAVNVPAGTGFRLSVASGVGTISATGGAAVFASACTVDLQLGIISSTNSSTTGVSLTSINDGTTASVFSAAVGSSITDATGTAFVCDTNNADVTYNGTITDDLGFLVTMVNNTGGTKSFTGAITDGNDADGNGISLTGNTGATISFSGGLTLSTGANPAFTATGGGTVDVTGSANTIVTTTATALNVGSTTIGVNNLTFRSISSNGGSATGIILDNTGSTGGLRVVGTGSAGTGGTIANKTGTDGQPTTGVGIYLNNTTGVQLDRMILQNFQNYAIRGLLVSGFTLANSTINATAGLIGTSTAVDEGTVVFGVRAGTTGLTGTATITNTAIEDGIEDSVGIYNSSGTLALTLNNTPISGSGNDGISVELHSTANATVDVRNSAIAANAGDHFQAVANGSAVLNVTFGTNGANTLTGGHPAPLGQSLVIQTGGQWNGTGTFNISNNTIVNAIDTPVNINAGGSGTLTGTIFNNTIGTNGVDNTGTINNEDCIRIVANGDKGALGANAHGGTLTVAITNNTLQQLDGAGIFVIGRDGGSVSDPIELNVTIQSNLLRQPTPADPPNSFSNAIRLESGASSSPTPDNVRLHANIGGAGALANVIQGDFGPGGGDEIRIRHQFSASCQFILAGLGADTSNTTTVINYLTARNTIDPTRVISATIAGGGVYKTGGAAPLPLLFAPAEVEGFSTAEPDSVPSAIAWTESVRQSMNRTQPSAGSTRENASGSLPAQDAPAAASPQSLAALTQSELDSVVAAARAHWEAAGLSAEQKSLLSNLSFEVADLPGWYLGENGNGAIRIDADAGGNGWFIDTTSAAVSDHATTFNSRTATAAPDRIDLLTTVLHEMGHSLGLCDTYSKLQRNSVMYGFLTKGERRLPTQGQASGAVPHEHATPHHLGAPVSVGTLPAGKSVTIKYDVVVNDPPLSGSLTSQATISGGNFASVLTDDLVTGGDPLLPGAADPTVTLVELPDVTVTVSAATVAEDGATTLTYTFSRQGSTTQTMAVGFSITGAATLDSSDYSLTNGTGGTLAFNTGTGLGTLTFLAGSSSATVTLAATDDTTVELDEAINLSITASPIYDIGVPGIAGATITNDDTDVVIDPLADTSLFEDQVSNFAYTFKRTGVTTGTTVANFTVGGTSTFNTDYTSSGATTFTTSTGSVTFLAGETTKVVTLDPTADNAVESNETIILTVTSGTGYNPGATPAQTATIVDDDVNVSVAVTPPSSVEDSSTGMVYTFTRSGGGVSNPLTVNVGISGTAAFAGDYITAGLATNNGAGAATITFAGGTATKTVTITPSADATSEPDETVILTVAANGTPAVTGGYVVGSPSAATGTITDDDLPQVSVATVAVGDNDAAEGGSNNGVFTFSRNQTTGSLVANFQLDVSSTAVAGTDFTLAGATTFDNGTGAGTIAFANGVGTATVTLTALTETPNGAEAAETARLNVVASPGVYVLGASTNATVTINANSFLVTTTTDSGTGSLRQAVLNANAIAGTDIVTFNPAGFATAQVITLTSGDLVLTSDLTIQGTGASLLTISGGNVSRVFTATSGTAVLTGLTVTGGNGVGSGLSSGAGGGIFQQFAALTLRNCVVTGNTASSSGGGIFCSDPGGSLALVNCTISGNTAAAGGGGGVWLFGAPSNVHRIIGSTISGNTAGTLGGGVGIVGTDTSIINSTLSGNIAGSHGGGVYMDGGGLLLLSSATVTGNRCDANPDATVGKGGGISLMGANAESLNNTIVAGNLSGGSPSTTPSDIDSVSTAQTINTAGNNVIGNAGTAGGITHGTSGNIVGNAGTGTLGIASILNTTLANNGGATQTHALVSGSAALNAGNSTFLPIDTFDLDGDSNTAEVIDVDQRGATFTRAIGTLDIGAFELQKSISILADAASAVEGTGAGNTAYTFTVSRTGDTSGVVNFSYAVTGTGGNPANAADFGGTLPSGTGSFLAAASTATVTINVSKDALAELDEGFTVTISNPDSGFIVSGATASSIITNDDTLTVTINQAAAQPDPINAGPINFTAAFSEPVTGFVTGDITLGGTAGATTGTVSEIAPNNGTTYNVAVTGMTVSGTVIASVGASKAVSAGGAANAASTSLDTTVTYDVVSPTVSMTSGAPSVTNVTPIPVTVTFSEAVANFTAADIVAGNATVANFAGSGLAYTFDLVPSGQGLVTANIPAGVANDAATNLNTAAVQFSRTFDSLPPTVSSVTSSTANGSYKAGDVISILANFSEAVTVTGTPQLTLETGATDRTINYASGSGSSTLTFNYTVQAGDTSADLDYVGTSALAFNGGTIQDAVTNNAILTLASPGAAGSLGASKAIVIDTAVPTVASVTSSTANGSYKAGDVISIQANFSEAVTVTGTPQLTLETGATDRTINYASGSGTSTLTFSYTAQAGDTSADLDYISTGALALNGGTIRDAAGNNSTLTLATPGATNSLGANKNLVIDTTVPTVAGVSSSAADGTYYLTNVIPVTVTFSEAVVVTGTPQLTLETGATDRVVNYSSGSGTSTLTFTYTVQSNDVSADLDYISTGSIGLNGGTIRDAASNNAVLTLASPGAANSLGANKNLVIDGTAPAVTSVTSTAANGGYAIGGIIPVTVTFSSAVNVTGTPQLTLETGSTDRVVNYSSGSGTTTLTFTYTVQAGDASADLDYQSTTALALNGATMQNIGGANAVLTLPTPGAANSLGANKNIVVDGVVPTVASVSSSTANGGYKAGDALSIQVNFSEAVTVTGTPQLTLETGTTDQVVNYASGSGTSALTFTYTVQAGDVSADLDYQSTTALALNGGTIRDAVTNNAVLTLASPGAANSLGANKALIIDTTAPTVAMTSVAANPTPNGAIPVTVTFSESVTGFTAADIVAGSGSVSDFSGSGTSYTFNLNPTSPGVLATADIAAGAAQDVANNGNTAATQFSRSIIDQVSITATDATAAETGGDTALYTFTRGGVTGDLVVNFQVDVSSTASVTEYAFSGASVTFATATSSGTVTIPATQTAVILTLTAGAEPTIAGGQPAEPSETVQLNVVPVANVYAAGTPSAATATIQQNGFVVVNANDAADGSLRQAVDNANALSSHDIISFATPQNVVLTSGELLIQNNGTLTILGGGSVSISGNNTSRVFNVNAGAQLTLRELWIKDGNPASDGGAIFNAGALDVISSTLSGNAAIAPLASGGAIFNNSGVVGVVNSTISGNAATAYGGAVHNSTGIVSVVNSTISSNTAGTEGGGLYNDNGSMTVDSSTVTANSAANGGGGLYRTGGNLSLYNSIIAGNTSTSGAPDLLAAAVFDANNNLIGVNTGHPLVNGTSGNIVGTAGTPANALLGPLADNGGPTLTHMLLDGSPAVNAGDTASLPADFYDVDGNNNMAETLAVDQRGATFARVIGSIVDIGAYEAFAFRPAFTTATTNEDIQSTSGLVITPNTADGGLTTHFKVTNIQNGTLYQNDGTTAITAGTFLTLTEGAAGLKFTPALNLNNSTTATFGFEVQAAVSGTDAGLRSGIASPTVSVTPVNDAPTVVSPGLADQTMTVGGTRSVALPPAFTDVDLDTLTFTVQTNSDNAKASAVINGTNVDLVALASGATNITIQASDGNLGTVTDTFQVAVGTVNPTPAPIPPPPGPGGYPVAGQTGTFDIVLPVTNTTAFPINGFRLSVDYSAYLAAYPSLRLYNASSAPGVSPAYIDYPFPVAVGGTVNVKLSFFTSTRTFPNPFNPVLTVTSLPVSQASGPPGPGVPATIRLTTAGQILLEWASTAGAWYQVQYSDDMVNWYTSTVPVQASSNRTQWVDTGAPFTHSPPVGSRFYRVSGIPVPTP